MLDQQDVPFRFFFEESEQVRSEVGSDRKSSVDEGDQERSEHERESSTESLTSPGDETDDHEKSFGKLELPPPPTSLPEPSPLDYALAFARGTIVQPEFQTQLQSKAFLRGYRALARQIHELSARKSRTTRRRSGREGAGAHPRAHRHLIWGWDIDATHIQSSDDDRTEDVVGVH